MKNTNKYKNELPKNPILISARRQSNVRFKDTGYRTCPSKI